MEDRTHYGSGNPGDPATGAMIFAAGLGTRLKPWTDKHPKALAVVNGKTLLQRNIEYLQQYGITDVVINVHHFPEQVIAAIAKADGWGSTITISDESDELLDTGGGLLKAKHLLFRQRLITLNVDILTDLNLKSMLSAHQQQGSLITLAVTSRKTSRYLLFNEYNRLCGWRNYAPDGSIRAEKIAVQSATFIEKGYSGIAIFEPAIFDLIPFTGKFSIIDVYLALAPRQKISGYDHTESKLVDVGKPESIVNAEQMFS